MIRFIDGAAVGVELSLRRAPILLRVVRNRAGNWDALDQPNDQATVSESIFVYRLVAEPTWIRVCARGKGGKDLRGYWWSGDYEQLCEQPSDAVMRDNNVWATWCEANQDRFMPDWAKRPATGGAI